MIRIVFVEHWWCVNSYLAFVWGLQMVRWPDSRLAFSISSGFYTNWSLRARYLPFSTAILLSAIWSYVAGSKLEGRGQGWYTPSAAFPFSKTRSQPVPLQQFHTTVNTPSLLSYQYPFIYCLTYTAFRRIIQSTPPNYFTHPRTQNLYILVQNEYLLGYTAFLRYGIVFIISSSCILKEGDCDWRRYIALW